jgi:hypothetical protein
MTTMMAEKTDFLKKITGRTTHLSDFFLRLRRTRPSATSAQHATQQPDHRANSERCDAQEVIEREHAHTLAHRQVVVRHDAKVRFVLETHNNEHDAQ